MGIGVFNFYNADHKIFIKELAERFKVNIDLKIAVKSKRVRSARQQIFNFGYDAIYTLYINYYHRDENKYSKDYYIHYELRIPIEAPKDKELTLDFGPNGILEVSFLTFQSTWHYFIKDLKGENDHYSSHQNVIDDINKLRKAYKEILLKLDCKEILIYPDANHKFENTVLFTPKINESYTFKKIVSLAKKLDNLVAIDFCTLLDVNDSTKNNPVFMNTKELEIVLIDKFDS